MGVLSGCRVLELGSTVAGPFCARLLADFGAEVVKIEIAEGDPIRELGESVNGKSLYAASILRNKSIASFDFRKPESHALIKKLIKNFDIVVENFRPGTLEKWGLGYDDLIKLKPDLIMTRVSGYGQTGPYKNRSGYGVIGEAMSGLRHMIGDPDRPPSRVAIPLTDYITALYAAYGTLLAIISRNKTGLGQVVDASLIESAFSFMELYVPTYEKTNTSGMRSGTRLPNSAPNNLYPTRDNGHIHIAAFADSIFNRLTEAMNMPQLATDPLYSNQASRNNNEDHLDQIITNWTVTYNLDELEKLLNKNNVPASRIYTMADIFKDPHYLAREMLVNTKDDDLGEITLAGIVPKLSNTPGEIKWSGHRTGQYTRDILKKFCELTDAEVNDLENKGVIFCDQPNQ